MWDDHFPRSLEQEALSHDASDKEHLAPPHADRVTHITLMRLIFKLTCTRYDSLKLCPSCMARTNQYQIFKSYQKILNSCKNNEELQRNEAWTNFYFWNNRRHTKVQMNCNPKKEHVSIKLETKITRETWNSSIIFFNKKPRGFMQSCCCFCFVF